MRENLRTWFDAANARLMVVHSSAGMSGDWGDFTSYREYMDAVNEQLLVVSMI